MTAVDSRLRLSALRALLGAIGPQVRLVKVRRDGSVITFTVVAAGPLDEADEEALSIAATEIIADFPDCLIDERLLISDGPLPIENALTEGWIYRRAER
jgi:hypothetical protein